MPFVCKFTIQAVCKHYFLHKIMTRSQLEVGQIRERERERGGKGGGGRREGARERERGRVRKGERGG